MSKPTQRSKTFVNLLTIWLALNFISCGDSEVPNAKSKTDGKDSDSTACEQLRPVGFENLPVKNSNTSAIKVTVNGEGITSYRFAVILEGEANCGEADYSGQVEISEKIMISDLGDEGLKRICAIGLNEDGNEQCKPSVYEWTYMGEEKKLLALELTSDETTFAAGTKTKIAAVGHYSDGTTNDVTEDVEWTTATPATLRIDRPGEIYGIGPGTGIVTASLDGLTRNLNIIVSAAQLVEISIATTPPTTPAALNLIVGTTGQLNVTAKFSDNSTQTVTDQVTWTTTPANIVSVSTQNGTQGRVTALAAGTASIKANYLGKMATVNGTVVAATLASIAITPASPSVVVGLTTGLTATGTYNNGSTANLTSSATWTSSNTGVATVGSSGTTYGIVTGVSAGTSIITANVNGVTATKTVTVNSATLTSIALTPASFSMFAGGVTKQVNATGTYNNGTTQDLTSFVTWSSSSPSVASVSNASPSKGLVTSGTNGTANISATYGNVQTSSTFTINPVTLTSLAFTTTNNSVVVATNLQLRVTGTFNNGTTSDQTGNATWSSNSGNAKVSNVSGSKGVVTGMSVGAATITASIEAVTTSTNVAIKAPILTGLTISPATATDIVGATRTFRVFGSYENSTTADLTSSAVWSSSNTSIATVGNDGASKGSVTAISGGSATIQANFGGFTTTATYQVTPVTLTSITVSPNVANIALGGTYPFSATGFYNNGTNQNMTSSATWASSNTAVSTVSNSSGSNGRATSTGVGSASISATIGSVTGRADLNVGQAIPESLAIAPAVATGQAGTFTTLQARLTYTDGSVAIVSNWPNIAWTSDNANIASVGATGIVYSARVGTTTIRATFPNMSAAQAQFTVTGNPEN